MMENALTDDGTLTVLAKGTNEWVCVPGSENKIGEPPKCMNPMGMRWMMDAMQGKPKPTNDSPGMIYMLCGAPQRSNTDPADRTSPAIPIGPHWMITWPFDAKDNGLPTTVRDTVLAGCGGGGGGTGTGGGGAGVPARPIREPRLGPIRSQSRVLPGRP